MPALAVATLYSAAAVLANTYTGSITRDGSRALAAEMAALAALVRRHNGTAIGTQPAPDGV